MRRLLNFGLGSTLVLAALCSPLTLAAEPSAESNSIPSKSQEETSLGAATPEVVVDCIEPHLCCAESGKVLETLQTMVKAINNHDWKTYENYLDDHCTTFDENTKKLIAGKENVVADMRDKVEKYAKAGAPFLHVTIDHPYAKVISADTAIVNLVAIREYGGKHPFKEECKVTDIFVKHGDTWKKCHFRGTWKRV